MPGGERFCDEFFTVLGILGNLRENLEERWMRNVVEMDITEKEHKHSTIRGCQPLRQNLTIQQITLPTNRGDLYIVPYKTHKPLKKK